MKLDPTKEYQYRNGEKPWRIIWDVPNEDYTILSITQMGDTWFHFNDGVVSDDTAWSDNDLIEVKKKVKGYVNVYKHDTNNIFALGWFRKTRQEAVEAAEKGQELFACIEIEFEEGEGL